MGNYQKIRNHSLTRFWHNIQHYKQLLIRLISLLLLAELVAACSTQQHTNLGPHKPHIIATTPAWAAVAHAITSTVIPVKSILDATTDPHDFEPAAVDIQHLNQADLIIANGGGYDDSLLRGVENPSHIINAFTLGHKSPSANMHVFLDLPTVILVAQKLTDTLDQQDQADAAVFNHNMQIFKQDVQVRIHHLQIMQQRHRPSSVIQTESVGTYILNIAHIWDKSPASLKEDKEPSAADINQITESLTRKSVSALIINQGAQNSRTDNLKHIAQMSGVPVINFSESPAAGQGYVDWIDTMITPLILAVRD